VAKQPNAIQSNVSSELWAEALAIYTSDKGVVDRANGQLRKHQLAYEGQGIDAKQIRERYKEAQLTEDERIQLYADEQISRRALDLWSAESPEDFEALIERAARTEPATGPGADKLAGARAYNDGFNGGAHGGLTPDNNPHQAGSEQHQQWAHGCTDGVDYAVTFGNGKTADVAPREAPVMEASGAAANGDARAAAPKKARGRPPRKAPLELIQENAEKLGADPEPTIAEDVAAELDETPANGLFSEMPPVPGMPV
jgi:hypothetical protein